jgi:hypothetical protein
MTLFNFCIVDRAGKLLFSYYFGPATIAEQDKWEAALATSTRAFWEACFRQDCPAVVDGRYVLLRGAAEMIFVMSGIEEHDELARK